MSSEHVHPICLPVDAFLRMSSKRLNSESTHSAASLVVHSDSAVPMFARSSSGRARRVRGVGRIVA